MTAKATTPETDGMEYIDVHAKGQKKAQGYFAEVPTADIEVIKGFNPRGGQLGDLTELEKNIKAEGILQNVVLREHPKKPDKYQLICGERRFTVAGNLKFTTVPAIVRTDLADDTKALTVALAENSEDARTSPGPVQLGRAFERLDKAGMGVAAIANQTGYNAQKVRRYLKLVKDAPKPIVAAVEKGEMGTMAALQVAKLPAQLQKKLKDKVTPDMSTTDIKKLAKQAEKEEGKVANTTSAPTKARAVDAVVWRAKTDVTRDLATACSFIQEVLNSDDEDITSEIGTSYWYVSLGQVLALLTVRGDLDVMPTLILDDDGTRESGTLVLDPEQVSVEDDEGDVVEAPTAAQTKKAVAEAKKVVKHIGDCIERYAALYDEKFAPVEDDEEYEEAE